MRLFAGKCGPFLCIAATSALLGGCHMHAFDAVPHQRMSIKDNPADGAREPARGPVVKAVHYTAPDTPKRPQQKVVEETPAPSKAAKNEPPAFVAPPAAPKKAEASPAPVAPSAAPPQPDIAKPVQQRVTEAPVTPAQPEKTATVIVPPLPFVVPVPMTPTPPAATAPAPVAAAAQPVTPSPQPKAAPVVLPPLPPVAAPTPQAPTLVMPPPVAAPPKAPEKAVAAPSEPLRTATRRAEPAAPAASSPKVEVIVPAKPETPKAEAQKADTKSEQQLASAASVLRQVPAPQPQSKTVALPKSSPEELIDRANLLLSVGNIASARDLLNDAARGGNRDALIELGGSYDPVILAKFLAVPPGAADPQRALGYYEQASAKGSEVAKARIDALRAHLAKSK